MSARKENERRAKSTALANASKPTSTERGKVTETKDGSKRYKGYPRN
jgi:hypothetical protein